MSYSGSKAGLIKLTKNLARVLAPEVRVSTVAPGVVDTEWTRSWPKEAKQGAADRAVLKRICTPQDIADVIVFLCVGTSMITGQTIVIEVVSRSKASLVFWTDGKLLRFATGQEVLEKLLDFIEKGGEIDVIPPESPKAEDGAAESVAEDIRQLRPTAEELRKIEHKQKLLGLQKGS